MVEKINGGYILLARNIINSEIWQKPPAYLKIWIYILALVSYKKSKKNDLGEYVFNFKQTKIPGVTTYQIYEFLRWAKTVSSTDSTTQITTQKTTRGIRLKVTKYAYYQDVKNYVHQNTYQQTHQQIPNTITKTLNNTTKEYIYNTHTIKKNVCVENNNLSDEDLKILRKYAKENGARRIKPYIAKLIENGGYIDILKEEKERLKKLERQKAKEEIPPPEKISEPERERMSIEDVRALVKNKMKRRET